MVNEAAAAGARAAQKSDARAQHRRLPADPRTRSARFVEGAAVRGRSSGFLRIASTVSSSVKTSVSVRPVELGVWTSGIPLPVK